MAIQSLIPWLDRSQELRELELARIYCVSGFHLHLSAKQLTKVVIRQCYQMQEPALVAPKIETLVIEHCPMTRFHPDTHLPQLKKLLLSSRNFTALHSRILVEEMHLRSPALMDLSFAGCSRLEEVTIEAEEIPALRRLDCSGCPMLSRVHVTSKLLKNLNLSCNDSLQCVVLNVESMENLDLSFLKNLTNLSISSPSLRRLNLQGCCRLQRDTISINLSKLHSAKLHGTTLKARDF
ncbi:hypothetical protein CCR75_000697 [Bremia lactucae]|uniref:Uncharacterized protein n=1 Tax=Bremia lactucae TaxID=4779 RepID=A0A976IB62_BRELC|nr:hypothetical protein CCR75_000697 [Bremia lactucae]